MMRKLITNRFADLVDSQVIRFDEPLKEHSSFKIGGPAEVFASPKVTPN